MSSDDLKVGSVDRSYWSPDLTKEGSKKRSRQRPAEPEEEPIDQVTLSSAIGEDEQLPGYFPTSTDQEKK